MQGHVKEALNKNLMHRLSFEERRLLYLRNLEEGNGLLDRIADALLDIKQWALKRRNSNRSEEFPVFMNNHSDAAMRVLG